MFSALDCGNKTQTTAETRNDTTTDQPTTPKQSGPIIGEIQWSDLRKEPHASWFEPMLKSYEPEAAAMEIIRDHIGAYQIKAYMGTWCADSKREIPKLYKILELSDYEMDKLEIIGVTRNKTLPDDSQKAFDVQYVPTIIFLKDGEEVGRFVEYPQESFEEDIAKIVSGQPYKHAYQE